MNIEEIKYVVDNSDYVKINYDKVNEVADQLVTSYSNHWFKEFNFGLTEKEIILLFFLCQSMNYCFWQKPKWLIEYKNNTYKGSMALFYSIVRKVEEDKDFLNINNLIDYTKEDLNNVFRTITVEIPLLEERYQMFMDTVKTIYNKKDSFYDELYNINSDIELLEYIMTNFNSFIDESIYKNKKIVFNKRGNLLVEDLYELSPTIKSNIKTIDNVLGCADYVIPRILRQVGILEYDIKLENIVDNLINLEHNSYMEIEIRANMIYAIELIKKDLELRNIKIPSVKLDGIIWELRNQFEFDKPHHNTITTCY